MATFLVSYALDKPNPQGESKLEERLIALSAVRILPSQWILNADRFFTDIEADLISYIDRQTDRLFLIRVTSREAAWHNLLVADPSRVLVCD